MGEVRKSEPAARSSGLPVLALEMVVSAGAVSRAAVAWTTFLKMAPTIANSIPLPRRLATLQGW